jgi:uncharacterized protein (DUF2235 family)
MVGISCLVIFHRPVPVLGVDRRLVEVDPFDRDEDRLVRFDEAFDATTLVGFVSDSDFLSDVFALVSS